MESQTLTLAASIALFQHTNSMGRAWRKNAKHGVFAPQSCLFICIVYICEHRDTLRPLVIQRTKYKTTNQVPTELVHMWADSVKGVLPLNNDDVVCFHEHFGRAPVAAISVCLPLFKSTNNKHCTGTTNSIHSSYQHCD